MLEWLSFTNNLKDFQCKQPHVLTIFSLCMFCCPLSNPLFLFKIISLYYCRQYVTKRHLQKAKNCDKINVSILLHIRTKTTQYSTATKFLFYILHYFQIYNGCQSATGWRRVCIIMSQWLWPDVVFWLPSEVCPISFLPLDTVS